MEQDLGGVATEAIEVLTIYGMNVIGAIVILIVGWFVSRWLVGFADKILGKFERIDLTLRRFFVSAVRYLVLIFTGLAVLSEFGVQTASLITVLGAAGLAIGLALQGTLSCVAAGVMLLLFRPFKIGDFVEVAGEEGTVGAITLFVTELATSDNIHVVVPNAKVWGAAVRNYSHHATRRLELSIGIGYDDDIDQALAAIRDVIAADARSFKAPAPLVAVRELGDSSVNLIIRVWSAAGDRTQLGYDLNKAIKQRLDAEGISIPYPQRTVHLVNQPSG